MSVIENNKILKEEGLLSLTKEASVPEVEVERKAMALIKEANGDAVQAQRDEKKKSSDKKRSMGSFIPGHAAFLLPAGSNVHGVVEGAKDGKKLKGALFGAHGVQGARDKEKGEAGKHLGNIAGAGAITGGALGAASGYAGHKIVKNMGIKNLPSSKATMAFGALAGGATLAGAGAAQYGLGSVFTRDKTK